MWGGRRGKWRNGGIEKRTQNRGEAREGKDCGRPPVVGSGVRMTKSRSVGIGKHRKGRQTGEFRGSRSELRGAKVENRHQAGRRKAHTPTHTKEPSSFSKKSEGSLNQGIVTLGRRSEKNQEWPRNGG